MLSLKTVLKSNDKRTRRKEEIKNETRRKYQCETFILNITIEGVLAYSRGSKATTANSIKECANSGPFGILLVEFKNAVEPEVMTVIVKATLKYKVTNIQNHT